MKTLYALIILLLSLSIGFSQSTELQPCGTQSVRSEWLKNYQLKPSQFSTRSSEILYVPMTIHIVGSDNGGSSISETTLAKAFCTLNADFEQVDIQFFISGEIKRIYNSAWNEHETTLKGAEMMFANNVEGTLNCYIVSNPAGNCGYNLPYAGIALSKNCIAPSDHTWSHEVGHGLSLPHPFLGWEGGVSYDGSVPHNFDNPAPTTVLFDYTYFKDTLILDTLIIDTAYVELVDGSNCHIAADGFCDTKPDYLASRWACNEATLLSNQEQTDPNGEKFFSDASLIMSYSLDNCASRFSPDQINAMRANLIDEKPEWLIDQSHPGDLSQEVATLSYPTDNISVYYRNVELAWSAIDNATRYLVQTTLAPNGQLVVFDTIVNSNNVIIPSLSIDKKYYWRVKALGKTDYCAEWSNETTFLSTEVSATHNIDVLRDIVISPNLLQAGESINIISQTNKTINTIKLINTSGVIMNTRAIQNGKTWQIPTVGLASGFYIVNMDIEGINIVSKIVITN